MVDIEGVHTSGSAVARLPEGSVLLHIGPYKTGSSAIQMAMSRRRQELAECRVAYPGRAHRQMRPGWALLGQTPRGRRFAEIDEWEELVREVRESRASRVCISTEDFGRAGPQVVSRAVRDLGADRVHVVAVARRLDKLLPSQWQERIKTCLETKSYDDWLRSVLDEDRPDPSGRAFWASHDLGRMIERWTDAMDRRRFHLIVTDDSDRGLLPRTFEQMLDLPEDMLGAEVTGNTSLSLDKVELLRRLNVVFGENGWSGADHHFIVEQGVMGALKQVPRSPNDTRIPPLPEWAVARVSELSEQRAAAVEASGVDVIGDAGALRIEPAQGEAGPPPGDALVVTVEAAARAVEGALRQSMRRQAQLDKVHQRQLNRLRRRAARAQRRSQASTPPSLDEVSGRELLRAAFGRAVRRLRRAGRP